MAKIKLFILILFLFPTFHSCSAIKEGPGSGNDARFKTGAARADAYIPLLKEKKVGVVANHTALVDSVHLVDLLIGKGIDVVKVFAPEHGFRGEAGPGDKVESGKDPGTGLPVISLYGAHRKPTPADLEGLDVMVFDIQDVGARFYTYISTLHYVMEACAGTNITVMVLDRPNPNGFYIDGPVLDTAYRSFVGIAPLPVVHGLTVGEYAKMALGEGWIRGGKCSLHVVTMEGYDHNMEYELPVSPSPNLPDMVSVYLYPSLCLFEGTGVSVGRGTPYPFQVIGYPGYKEGNFRFTPREIPGVIKDPPYENTECNGISLRQHARSARQSKRLNIDWLISMYASFPDKPGFFTGFFDKLAGTDALRKQIIAGASSDEIRKSWEPGLKAYRLTRAKYLLYPEQ